MSNLQKVIDPQVAMAMMSKMNGNSFLALLNQFLTDASDNDSKIDLEIRNEMKRTHTIVTNRMDNLDEKLDKATALAQLLEGKELTQLEAMFRKLIDSDQMQALFAGMCVKVGDKSYKLTSIIAALAQAPDEVAGELTYDAAGNNITGYVMELTDGIKVAFQATVTDDEEAGETTVSFDTDDFHGVAANFGQKFYRRTDTIKSFGKDRELVSRDLKSVSHVVIGLSADECEGHADPVPDLDNDGDNDGVFNETVETVEVTESSSEGDAVANPLAGVGQ